MINQKITAYTKENIYDFDNMILLHYYPKRIIEKMCENDNQIKNASLLELGLGHGYSALEFQGMFLKYTILEGDTSVIDKFINDHDERDVDIIHTMFENYETMEQYDVIAAGFVLEHVEDPLLILKKYRTMLKDEGKMFIAVPNAACLNRRVGYAAGMLSDIMQLSETDYAFGHKRYYVKESIESVCKLAGLQIKSVEGIYLKPFTTEQILSLNLDSKIIEALCMVGRQYPELCAGILVECLK